MRMSSALTTGTPIPSSASRSTRESDTHIKVLPRVHDKVAARASAEEIGSEKEIGESSVYENKENQGREVREKRKKKKKIWKIIYLRARKTKEIYARAYYTASEMENAFESWPFFIVI